MTECIDSMCIGRWVGPAVRRGASAFLLGLVVAACAGGDIKTDRQVARERVNAYLTANPQLDKETANAVRHYELRKGMTMRQVEAVWGRPVLVKKFRSGAVEQWFFGCDWPHACISMGRRRGRSEEEIYQSQALFENGQLVEWDD